MQALVVHCPHALPLPLPHALPLGGPDARRDGGGVACVHPAHECDRAQAHEGHQEQVGESHACIRIPLPAPCARTLLCGSPPVPGSSPSPSLARLLHAELFHTLESWRHNFKVNLKIRREASPVKASCSTGDCICTEWHCVVFPACSPMQPLMQPHAAPDAAPDAACARSSWRRCGASKGAGVGEVDVGSRLYGHSHSHCHSHSQSPMAPMACIAPTACIAMAPMACIASTAGMARGSICWP